MKLTFKRREVSDLQHLRTLVSDNIDAMEPGVKILASNLNLGRTNVELAALDARNVPMLFVLGLTADDAMLVRALEAYAWCLEYPESVQRLVPANVQVGWPPRIVFVAERLLEAFTRKMQLLNFSAVDCFEFRYVEANGTTGFYLDRVDWAGGSGREKASPRAERPARPNPPVVQQPVAPPEEPRVAPREEPRLVLLRDDARAEEPEPSDEPSAEPAEEEVYEELRAELHDEPLDEPREEPRVAPREEPRLIPLVPADEPRMVMLHETKLSPRPEPKPMPRTVEPAATNGAAKADSTSRPERPPALLTGLRPPAEAPPRRRSREVPDVLRPSAEQRPPSLRESVKPSSPTAPAASRAPNGEPRPAPASAARAAQPGVEPRPRSDAARVEAPKNGAKSEPRSDAPKGELAPTWRKFLDRLTSTFDTRPGATSAPETPRATAPTPSAGESTPNLVLQPFAADIEVSAHEVAPDEEIDESRESIGELSDRQRRALQGLTPPENGQVAPQRKKFLDRPSVDENKIAVVRGYLQREFPLCTVYDFYDFQRNAQVFQLQDNHGKVTQLIAMTAEFFDAHRDLEVRAWIEKHRLAQAMRQAGQAGVLVSQAGLQIEKR